MAWTAPRCSGCTSIRWPVIFFDPANLPFLYDYSPQTMVRFLITYICICFFTHLLDYYRETYRNRLFAKTEELQKALDKVKPLSGYLPVCASCKKARDSNGEWINLEEYLRNHSDAEISHGLCDGCAEQLCPSIIKEIRGGK